MPHNLAVEAAGRGYVADRDNSRIQVFDADGKFLDQWRDVGGVSSLFLTESQRLWTGGMLRALAGKVALGLPGTSGAHSTTVARTGDVFLAQLSGSVQRFAPQ